MSVHQFARLRGKSDDTIRRWIKAGKIEAEKDPGGRHWWVFIPFRASGTRPREVATAGSVAPG